MKRALNHTIIGRYGHLLPFEGKFRKVRVLERFCGYIVRFETRGKEFASVARLIQVAEAKANTPFGGWV